MGNGFVRVPLVSAGKDIDNEEIDVGGGQKRYRQRVQVGGDDLGEIAVVRTSAPAADDAGLVVRPVGGSSVSGARIPLYSFDDDIAVSSGVETTVLSYIVGVSTTAYIQGFIGTGSATMRFRLYVDGARKLSYRTSAADRTARPFLGDGAVKATAGQTVTVSAYHEEIAVQLAEVALFGFTE